MKKGKCQRCGYEGDDIIEWHGEDLCVICILKSVQVRLGPQ